jgi:hypothetical protein
MKMNHDMIRPSDAIIIGASNRTVFFQVVVFIAWHILATIVWKVENSLCMAEALLSI